MHSAIEHAKKATKIFIPSQWDTVIHMARYNKPYTVVPLKYYAFYDLRKLEEIDSLNFQVDANGQRVKWMKVKVLKVMKDIPDVIHVKYGYNDDDFKVITLKRKGKRGRPVTGLMPFVNKYSGKLPIAKEKKKDLVGLCQSGVIPKEYHHYYQSLKTSNDIVERLPQPDTTEEEPALDEDD